MQSTTSHEQVNETKLSQQFAELIDLTDANLEEISAPGFGRIQGGDDNDSCSCGRRTFVRVLVVGGCFGTCFGTCFGFGGLGFGGLGFDGLDGFDGLGGIGRGRVANAIDNNF